MKSPLRFFATLLVSFAVSLAATLSAATPQKPNVLFIAIDDLRDWVGYFGHNPQAKTPNFDRLAKMLCSLCCSCFGLIHA